MEKGCFLALSLSLRTQSPLTNARIHSRFAKFCTSSPVTLHLPLLLLRSCRAGLVVCRGASLARLACVMASCNLAMLLSRKSGQSVQSQYSMTCTIHKKKEHPGGSGNCWLHDFGLLTESPLGICTRSAGSSCPVRSWSCGDLFCASTRVAGHSLA